MANIDYKEGPYTIPARAAEHPFTFWWGSGSKSPHEFFDVSISPEENRQNEGMKPLVEVKREVYLDASEGAPRNVLLLYYKNPNDFPVKVIANHVRISN